MLSYVLSSNSLKNYPLQILNIEDNFILTTIPQNSNEPVFFQKGSIYTISHQSNSHLFQFEVRFMQTRTINNTTFYILELLDIKELKNIRKELRDSVSYPASFIHKNFNNTRLGCVIDVSKNGMKLETFHPIETDEIHISFEDPTTKRYKLAKIVWSHKQGNMFYYGLKLLADF